jgi:nicotinic acid mononucleotide adenylyltransferase
MAIAIYSGSFDPITNGRIGITVHTSRIFTHVNYPFNFSVFTYIITIPLNFMSNIN